MPRMYQESNVRGERLSQAQGGNREQAELEICYAGRYGSKLFGRLRQYHH